MPDKPKTNTIAPNDFLALLTELDEATRLKDRHVGKLRAVRQRMEGQGCDMPALDLALTLRKLGTSEAEGRLKNALRYVRWMELPIGAQTTLFDGDADMPSAQAKKEWTEAQAYEEGYKAGKAGRNRGDTRFPAGSLTHQRFDQGWIDGQAVIAEQLGRPAGEGETLKPPKRGPKAAAGTEKKAGAPRGRGGRRGRRGADGIGNASVN